MANLETDVVVIGSGPGGEGAAMQLSKKGKRVTLVERYEKIGGGCTHWGTIPSKALRFSIFRLTESLNNPLLIDCGVKADPTIAQLTKTAAAVSAKQESMRKKFYSRNNVEVVSGHARFVDANTVEVEGGPTIKTENVVIAAGARPYHPDNVDLSLIHI